MKPNFPGWIVALALLGGVIWAGILVRNHLAGTAGVIDRFETVLLDLRITLAGHRSPPREIVIVAIDDRTVAMSGQYPLSRSRMAELVDSIAKQGARMLAVDMVLSETADKAGEAVLARSISVIPTVIAEAGYIENVGRSASFVPLISTLLSPSPAVIGSASAGVSNLVTDNGGTPRHIPLLFLTPDGLRPSFSLKALGLYLNEMPSVTDKGLRVGKRNQSLDLGWHLVLNYYGPGGTIPTVSAMSLLKKDQSTVMDLEDRLVVLGVTATAIGERFSTPFDPVMPGVEVQATGIANLLDGSSLVRNKANRVVDGVAAIALSVLGLIAVAVLPLAPAVIFFLLLVAGWLAVVTVLFLNGYWFNAALPLAASLPPVTGLMIARQVFDRIHTRCLLQAQEALSRFQSPLLAKRISDDPKFLAVPQQQCAAILFVDLSGYTGLSEQLSAAETRDFLKEFHTIVVDVVASDNGVVLDFMGDGALFSFGVPEACRTDPLRAFKCAFKLQQAIIEWLEGSGMKSRIPQVRIGAHYGKVVLSRLGHDSQQQIAVTGDCVNVASRLLETAKDCRAAIVMSSDLIAAVEGINKTPVFVPCSETVVLRGRKKELNVGLWSANEIRASLRQVQSVQNPDRGS